MWTPHFQFDIISIEGNKSAEELLKVYKDETRRKFYIQFFLDDIRLRRKEVQFKAPDEREAISFTDSTGQSLKVTFLNNQNGRLYSIGCIVTDSNPTQATWYCFNRLSYLLSYWSLVNGGSQCIYGIRVKDTVHNLVYQSFPDTAIETSEPISVFTPPALNLTSVHRNMLSLYREARNSSSPYYSFLCAFKIMEGIMSNRLFADTDKAIRALKIDEKRQRGIISQGMLELARAHVRYPNFVEMRFKDFMEEVRQVRVQIAHAITDTGEMYDFDNASHSIEASILASLSDLVARDLLVEEFRLLDLISKVTSGIDDPTDPYIDESKFLFLRTTLTEGYEPDEKFLDMRD